MKTVRTKFRSWKNVQKTFSISQKEGFILGFLNKATISDFLQTPPPHIIFLITQVELMNRQTF